MTMRPGEFIKLSRDCEVVQIPEGFRVRIARGTEVRLAQALGDTYTLTTEYGSMVRLDGKDADAIGLQVAEEKATDTTAAVPPEEVEKQVWGRLRSVFDPEIPVNVVDLGLVYECKATPLPEGGNRVAVKMTLTAPGCGMGPVLQQDAEYKIRKVPGVKEAQVEIVVEPPWNQSMMSEAAKLELGL